MNYRQRVGSYTAKEGFANECAICEKFKNYRKDRDAPSWLLVMGYDFHKIHSLGAIQIPVRINQSKAKRLGVRSDLYQEASQHKKADLQLRICPLRKRIKKRDLTKLIKDRWILIKSCGVSRIDCLNY